MDTPRSLVALAAVLALVAMPLAHASLGASTPVAAACALVDNDACQQPWASSDGLYFLAAAGEFTGTVVVKVSSVADPLTAFTQSCTGHLVGVVMVSGGCWTWGSFPIGAMRLDCTTQGAGAVTCSVEGA